MYGEAQDHHEEVPAELLELPANIFHFEELAGHQETDSNGGEVDNPGGYFHHHDAEALKESQQRLAVFTRDSDTDTGNNAEHHQAELGRCWMRKRTNSQQS